MANYKVVDADQLDADLKTVADAIRESSGAEGKLDFPDGMATAASEIQNGESNGWCFACDSTTTSDVSFTYNGTTAYKVTDNVFSVEDLTGAYVVGWDNATGTVKECWKAQGFNQRDYAMVYLSSGMMFSFPTAGVKSIFGENNATVPEAGTYINFYGAENITTLIFKP